MAIQVARHTFNIEEYERMIGAGVFDAEERVELIRGEVVDMAPINLPHEACVSRLTRLLGGLVGEKAIVWPQNNSIRLPNSNSRPQPDVTLLKWRDDDYAGKAPSAEDVLLVVEVSESSLAYDSGPKSHLYAEAAIPQFWVVNLVDQVVEVCSRPTHSGYESVTRSGRGHVLPLPGGLPGGIRIDDVFK